ncbi:MAG TPA: hypothetical protein VLA89_12650, partial [Gemmatimonadales bacterium]|nr:hypothetical protein [Gemmatimonadales bacterium]
MSPAVAQDSVRVEQVQDSVQLVQARDSARVEHLIDSLPLRDRVAQLIMPWIPGNYAAFDDSAFSVMQGWVDS